MEMRGSKDSVDEAWRVLVSETVLASRLCQQRIEESGDVRCKIRLETIPEFVVYRSRSFRDSGNETYSYRNAATSLSTTVYRKYFRPK